MRPLIHDFNAEQAAQIKAIEQTTNHDVKAVEYFIKDFIKASQDPILIKHLEFVHFACTSEDINNLSHALMLKSAMTTVILPLINRLLSSLRNLATETLNQSMLASMDWFSVSVARFRRDDNNRLINGNMTVVMADFSIKAWDRLLISSEVQAK